MFCKYCGNQVEDNSKLCPFCGKDLSPLNADSVKDTLKKATETIVDSAKTIGNSVNEATDGQAQKYAEKAKETAQEFVSDIKQVAKDKDTSNFFTKNKYRNIKILAVLLIVIIILGALFDSEGKKEIMAKNVVIETFPNAVIKSVTKEAGNDKVSIYVVKFVFPNGYDEQSSVISITDDNADMIDTLPEVLYPRRDALIESLKKQLE